MSKEIFEIRNFNLGTYTTQSEVDIPQESAAYSLDVDPLNREGRLIGRPEDSEKVTSVNGEQFQMINRPHPDDAKQDIVYYDPSDKRIKLISDFYGTPTTSTISDALSGATDVSMTKSNQEVHIGLGKDQAPKWAGYVKDQFGTKYESVEVEDAELKPPELWQAMKEHYEDDTYLYAIGGGTIGSLIDSTSGAVWSGSWTGPDVFPNLNDGQYIYKFDKATGELVKKSEAFGDIASIALFDNDRSYGTGTNRFLWVFDRAGTTVTGSARVFGTVYKVDRDTFKIVQTNAITDTTISGNYSSTTELFFWSGQYIVCDMIQTGDYLWFAIGEYDYNSSQADVLSTLWNMVIINKDGDRTITPRMPWTGSSSGSDTTGPNWVNASDNKVIVSIRFPQNCLFTIDSDTEVGVLCKVGHRLTDNIFLRSDASSTTQLPYDNPSSDASARKGSYMLMTVPVNQTNDDEGGFATNNPIFVDDWNTETANKHNPYIFSTDANIHISYFDDNVNIDKVTMASFKAASLGSTIIREEELSYGGFNGAKALLTVSSLDNDTFYLFNSPELFPMGSRLTGHLYKLEKSGLNALTTLAIPEAQIIVEGTDDYVNTNNTIYYKVSFLYDSFQESPLSERIASNIMMDPAAGRLTVNINDVAQFNNRITHINIYTADNSYIEPSEVDGLKGFRNYNKEPDGFYRLVKQVRLDETWSDYVEESYTALEGKTKAIIDQAKTFGSYESLNDISETLENTAVNYSMSTVINSANYVAGCSHLQVENADNYIFKSKPFMYDQFDWSENYLRIENTPTAIGSFGGRIYLFDDNNTYKVNPDQFYIEDTFGGVGCINKDAMAISEFGLCFADRNNIYLHNGSQPQAIGARILKSDNGTGYQELLDEDTFMPKILFDGERKAFAVFVTADKVWMYSLIQQRWDLWSATECKGGFAGKKGEIFYSDGTNLLHQGGGDTNKTFQFISKKIAVGSDTQPKKFYRLDVGYRGNKPSNVAYSTEGSDFIDNVPTESGQKVSVVFRGLKKNNLQVKIEAEDGSEVESVGVVYRRYYKLVGIGGSVSETSS